VTPTTVEAVVIRFAEAGNEARLVAIDDATWSPLVRVDDVLMARSLDR
jgi:hypothetical protein